jgi:hypothetical protein
LPDSREATIVAPDPSNLPVGQRAIDPKTARTFGKDDLDK